MAECRSCGAAVDWATTTTGKQTPLDREPTQDGNVILLHAVPGVGPLAVTLSGPTLDRARTHGAVLRTSHFATCPNAAEHRR
jgi:hypothetical protein